MISEKCKLVIRITNIYTDGSKEDSKVGCAVISDNHGNMQRIPDDSSIFTAEAKAIDLALDFISTCDANNKGALVIRRIFSLVDLITKLILSNFPNVFKIDLFR